MRYMFLFMIVVAVFCYGCKKTSNTNTPGSEYTSKMGGTRNWYIHHHDNICPIYGSGVDTTYESSMTIIVESDVKVSFASQELTLKANDPVKKTVTFSYNEGSDISDTLVYYYLNDSMTYSSFENISVCDQVYYDMATL
jgi:hypothetical protein